MRLALGAVDELRERLERDGQVVVEHNAVERPGDARLEPLRLDRLLRDQPLDELLVLRSAIRRVRSGFRGRQSSCAKRSTCKHSSINTYYIFSKRERVECRGEKRRAVRVF